MGDDCETVLLHITGTDYPGILADVLALFVKHNIKVVDVQQTTSLGQLSLSLLVEIPRGCGLASLRDIVSLTQGQHLKADFHVLNKGELVRDDDLNTFSLTVLSKNITTACFESIARSLGDNNINIIRMNRLSRVSMECIELFLGLSDEHIKDFASIKQSLFKAAFDNNLDVAIQPENLYRRSKRLIVMDMDSTLIQQEVIDEIADFAGVKDKVAAITKRAMEGELDFNEALIERVALLKGIPQESLAKVIDRIQLTDGAENLIKTLKKLGYKTAVISGGFTYFTDFFKEKLGLDYSFANQLEVKYGKLTGKVIGEIVNREKKAELLVHLAELEKIPLDQTVAIGDGANDLAMLGIAGFGIAFNAKPKVKEQARAFISRPSLDSVLFLLGVSEKERTDMLN